MRAFPTLVAGVFVWAPCLHAAVSQPQPDIFVTGTPAAAIYHDGWIDLNKSGAKDPYEDPAVGVDARIDDLLARMTLEEKTAQMATLYGFARVLKDELPTPAWESSVWKDGIGNIDEQANGNTGFDGSYPDPDNDMPWSRHTRAINEVQRWFVERTRLGIPVDFTNEGIRGILHTGATSFPAQIGVASSFNKALVREIGRATGREARALGYTNVYSPILDLSRDPRWGRTVETYSEDPFLAGELGLQQVLGLQEQRVVSTPKHFAVYSIPKGGRDHEARTDPHATWSEVETVFLAPFRRAIRDGGAMGVMASYNDYDGVPVEASRRFLTDILRGEFGFRGYVVSDSGAVEHIHLKHRVAPTPSDAIRLSVEAGLNIRTNFTMPEAYIEPLRGLVREGRLPMATIDARVRDILRVKYWLGLFDTPYRLDPAATDSIVRAPGHVAVSEQALRESLILLKNEGGVLPLSATATRKILVTGPLADDAGAWYCRYGPQRLKWVTPLAGIRAKFGATAEVRFVHGVDTIDAAWPASDIVKEPMSDAVRSGIESAVEAARDVDVIIACLGESEELCRESRSRVSLNLPGYQDELLGALCATGKPVVVVLSNGRPLSINTAARRAAAILECWFSGENGGHAIADVLAGDYNPAGRLPITVPRSVGQIPLNFPAKPGSQAPDEGQVTGPLYPFGHGLSYTTFDYANLEIVPPEERGHELDKSVRVRVEVTNTGARAGDEVVQLYVRDDFSSVTTFDMNLRGFERVPLEPGETRSVEFALQPEHLQLLNAAGQWIIDPGRFTVMVGASSADIRQRGSFTVLNADGSEPVEATITGDVVDPM